MLLVGSSIIPFGDSLMCYVGQCLEQVDVLDK